jgi:cytochrome c-type biogenesis protein CcmH/NrfG
MTTDVERVGCPEAEDLAAYVDRRLPSAARASVERHLLECADCRHVVVETGALIRSTGAQTSVVSTLQNRWLRVGGIVAAAAAVIIAVRIGWQTDRVGANRRELVAAVSAEATRPIDGRLTGGFAYGPPPSAVRSADQRAGTDAPRVQVVVAAIEREARTSPSPELESTLGVAYLLTGDLDKAIAALERATVLQPNNPRFWSDLSAAYIERGLRAGGSDDYRRAREAADRALSLDPDLVEARFNLAASIERIGDTQAAVTAWRRVGELDRDSPWAAEAERRARALAGQ